MENERSLLLAIDVGNTNITFGIFRDETILHQWRIQTDRDKTSDEYGIELEQILSHFHYNSTMIRDVIIGSVVPDLMHTLPAMSQRFLGIHPLVVGEDTKTGIPIRMDNPKEVGADRIVNAVAGYAYYGGPMVIVDIGTAITFDVLNEKGEYIGGSIAPGIGITAEALFLRTAKLPKIELIEPERAIAKNTVAAMQSGLVTGFIGLIDRLIEETLAELKEQGMNDVKVVATGGYSLLLAKPSRYVQTIDKDLTLHGLRMIYERTMQARKA